MPQTDIDIQRNNLWYWLKFKYVGLCFENFVEFHFSISFSIYSNNKMIKKTEIAMILNKINLYFFFTKFNILGVKCFSFPLKKAHVLQYYEF